MTIYSVVWARACGGNDAPVDAFAGCVRAFTDPKKAEDCLASEVDAFLEELRNTEDPDDRQEILDSLQVTGGALDWSVEIDYTAPDGSDMQWYFTINETELES